MLMPLRRYAEFSGRSRRKEYWMFFLGVILFYILMLVLMMALGGGAMLAADNPAGMTGALAGAGIIGIIFLLAMLALLIPSLAVGIRRLHDIDRTGWWMLAGYGPYLLSIVLAFSGSVELAGILNLISLAGFLLLLVFAVLPGTPGPNRYGPDPKGRADEEIFA
jgi:uncharacterized membrane protein YhaH (DUF805 family)